MKIDTSIRPLTIQTDKKELSVLKKEDEDKVKVKDISDNQISGFR